MPRLAILVASLMGTSTALAGGLVVPGAGPTAQPRAGAFVARADDASTIGHNPAGLAKQDGTSITIGANFINYDLTYQRAGAYELSGELDAPDYEGLPYPEVSDQSKPSLGLGGFQLLPTIGVVTDLGMPHLPFRVGVGLFTPQGYIAREYQESHDLEGATTAAPGPQRYDVINQEALLLLPSVAIGWSLLPDLDVGARFSWGISQLSGKKTVWAIRNYEEFEGRDSVFTLEGASDYFVPGFGVGVLYRPSPSIELGANYNSVLKARAVGTGSAEVGEGIIDGVGTEPIPDDQVRCAKGGREGALKICFDLTIGMSAQAGGRYIFRDGSGAERADIELDLRWEDWSASADNLITADGREKLTGRFLEPGLSRHGYEDVLSVRLGGSYTQPIGGHKLIGRAGVAYDTAAAPDSWTRADQDGKARTTIGLGAAYDLGRYRIDFGGGVVLEGDVEVEPCKPPDGPDTMDPGCSADGETPVLERESPDPQQPLFGKLNQLESPFNAGIYKSGYVLFSVGVTARF
jgi:long-subunit fatty acid transport protein